MNLLADTDDAGGMLDPVDNHLDEHRSDHSVCK